MSVRLLLVIFGMSCTVLMTSQTSEKSGYSGGFEALGYLSNESLPFWAFTNEYGSLTEDSNGLFYAFAKAHYSLSSNATLDVKASGLIRDGVDPSVQRAELYVTFKNRWLEATAGSQNFTQDENQLSSIRRNILFSSNTRALPGVLLQTAKPIRITKKISVDAAIAQYILNDNRFVDNALVHYKNLYFRWDINKTSSVRGGLQHVAQWGGTSTLIGPQPQGFSDFVRIFLGSGGGDNANFGDQINTLGNHIGSYSLTYTRKNSGNLDFEVYYQTLFEDRSGVELNNFPDGVWGISVKPKNNKIFKEFLYEYVQTVSQSGRPRLTQNGGQQSGGDNYFTNSIYRSGWTYEGRTIGLPFINVVTNSDGIDPETNNRSFAHHLGVRADINRLQCSLRLTFLENLGTFAVPRVPRETFLYSYFQASLPTEKLGAFNLAVGADWGDTAPTTFGGGIGYTYNFNL